MTGFEDDPEQEGVNATLELLRYCIDIIEESSDAAR